MVIYISPEFKNDKMTDLIVTFDRLKYEQENDSIFRIMNFLLDMKEFNSIEEFKATNEYKSFANIKFINLTALNLATNCPIELPLNISESKIDNVNRYLLDGCSVELCSFENPVDYLDSILEYYPF